MKIFVTEDATDLLDITKAVLTRKGFEVETHAHCEDALKKIKTFEPQLLLLDVFLNGIDGLDICRQLKTMPHTKHIPVLIFSSYPQIGERVIYEYGADDFIAKPFEVNDLVSKMHSILCPKEMV